MPVLQPDIRPIKESGEIYILNEDYSYTVIRSGKVIRFTVPRGFQYDGASVPRWVWSVIGFLPDGIHRPAALIHDYLYAHEGIVPGLDVGANKECTIYYDRMFADNCLRSLMRDVGIKSWHIKTVYWAVRTFGGTYWADPVKSMKVYND